MYKVLKNEKLNECCFLMEVEAPLVVKNCLPGQFAIIMGFEDSERIPLTIYDYDREKGILSLIYQVIGASTLELTTVKDELFSVVGPLGKTNEICKNPEEFKGKKLVYVAGGVGIAPVYPQIKYLHNLGFEIDVIYGCRNEELLLIKDKVEAVCDNAYFITDDGSSGRKGFVTDILKENIDKYDVCVAIGPLIMLKNVSLLTKEYNLKTIVSLNPIMVDGTGMCGACRCEAEGKPKFACVDGPEFDGHTINYDPLIKRMNTYKELEVEKYEIMKKRLGV